MNRCPFQTILLLAVLCFPACSPSPAPPAAGSPVTTRGTLEITARLVEIPDDAIVERGLYDYATVLKYDVEQIHRGELAAKTIYIAHYNPFRSRAKAADGKVKNTGGTLERFLAGDRHRIALDGSVEDQFMGGVINKYFGRTTGPVYWAVWTDPAP